MNRSPPAAYSLLIVALLQQNVLLAAEAKPPLPGAYLDLARCRELDAAARLPCFDAAVAALDRAVASEQLFITDRAQINAAKAASFGLATPAPGLTLNEAPREAGKVVPDELVGTIKSVRSTPNGWVVALEDGSVWQQADNTISGIDPAPGMGVTIKQGALGSFRLVFNKNVGFKVRRAK